MPYYANDDNVIKTRLFQEEKNLKKFFSKYAAVSASGTSASAENGSNDFLENLDTFLLELTSIEQILLKHSRTQTVYEEESEMFNRRLLELERVIENTKSDIQSLNDQLLEARVSRERKTEYDKLAHKILSLPSRSDSKAKIETLRQDTKTLEGMLEKQQERFQSKADRLKQVFQILYETQEELKEKYSGFSDAELLEVCATVSGYASVDIESVVKHEEEDLAKFYSDVWNDLKTKAVRPFTVARRNAAVGGLGSLADLDSQPVYFGEQYDISFALPKTPLKQFITVRIEAASVWVRMRKPGVFLCQMNFLEYLDLYKTSRGLNNNLIYETEHGAIYNLVLDLREQPDGDLKDKDPNKLVPNTKFRVVYEAWDKDPSQPMGWFERFKNWYSMKRFYSPTFQVLPKAIELSKEWFFNIFGGKTLQTLLDNKFLFSGHVYSLAGSQVSLDDIYESRDFKEWKHMAFHLAKFLKHEIVGNVKSRDTPTEVIRRAGIRARKFAIAMSLSEDGAKVLEVLGNILSNAATSVMLSDTVFQQADKNGRRQLLNLNLRELLLRNRVVRRFFGEDDPIDAPMKTVIDKRTQQNRLQKASFWYINKKSKVGKEKINTFYTLQENQEFVENSRQAGFMVLKKEIKTLVVCAIYVLWKEVRAMQNSQFQLLYSAALNSAGYRFTLQAKYIEVMAKKKIADAKKAKAAAASQKLKRKTAFKRIHPNFGPFAFNEFAKSRISELKESFRKNKKKTPMAEETSSVDSEKINDTSPQEPDTAEAMPENEPETVDPQATDPKKKKKKKGFKEYYEKVKKAFK